MYITKQSVLLLVNYFSQGSIREKCKVPLFFSLVICFVIGATESKHEMKDSKKK